MGASFNGDLVGKPGTGLILGSYGWKKVLGQVSLPIGALLGNLGRGSVYREL